MRDVRRPLLALAWLTVAVFVLWYGAVVLEAAEPLSIRITSPLGRTGVSGKIRVVAQVRPAGVTAAVRFFVDREPLGTSDGPLYAVEWTDDNPFEPRELSVVATDADGRTARDTIVLPSFAVIDVAEVMSVLLEAGVYDRTGRSVATLDVSAFSVKEDGETQALDLVSHEVVPATLVVMVDNSQSMSRRMGFVRQAAGRLVSALGPKDSMIVAPFTTALAAVTGPTHDPPTVVEAIDAMRAGGGTAILDGLIETVRLLDTVEGRRAIILITDGYDENSTTDAETALQAAQAAHVTVYVIGIGGVAGISLKGERLLRRIAIDTGGRAFFPPRETDLPPIAAAVAADSQNRYLIGFTPRNQSKDGSWRQVTVVVPDGYTVRTRSGYFAPAPAPVRPAIEFTVTDRSRAYVEISAGDLTVFEDGVEQRIDAFQEAVNPVSIVMAIDASGSMKRSTEAVKAAAREFVAAVRPEDSLALVTFADAPTFVHLLSTNRQQTLDAVEAYHAAGGTALYDALFNSLTHLDDAKGRRALVVLTDGRDENNPGTAPGSTHTIDDVLRVLKTTGAIIYPIGLGARIERSLLERLARESGGEAYFAGDASMLPAEFARVVENLRRRYVVTYVSTNSAHDGAWRGVEVRPTAPGMRVSSLGGYFSPER